MECIKVSDEQPQPYNLNTITALDGYETYKIDDNTIGIRPKWISCKDRLPKISYNENDQNDTYTSHPVLVYCNERPGIQCVAYLVQEQDENSWNFEELSWELYIPGNGGEIIDRDFETFTHWMPLPSTEGLI